MVAYFSLVSLAEKCETTDGTPCHFPFDYDGELYYRCTQKDNARYWCSTTAKYSTDDGDCSSNCPLDGGKYFNIVFRMRDLRYDIICTYQYCLNNYYDMPKCKLLVTLKKH